MTTRVQLLNSFYLPANSVCPLSIYIQLVGFVLFKNFYIYLWLLWVFVALPGPLSCVEWGLLFVTVRGFIAVFLCCGTQALGMCTSVVVDCRLYSVGSVVVAHGHNCSTNRGIFLPCPMH